MRMPTSDECESNATRPIDGRVMTAAWYPQMGGYVGKCWIDPQSSGCFDVYVYHDGEFPFTEADGEPKVVHHCMAEQFIEFGKLLQRCQR